MFRRPSNRRRSERSEINPNLVPMLDALVTLVSFLLMTMGYMAISVIETPAPMLAPPEEQVKEMKKDEPPLQLTADIQEKRILIHDWTGSRENHVIPMRDNPEKPGEQIYDLEALHTKLMEIKARHPKDRQIILKPDAGISYDSIVTIMDAARFFEKTDVIPQPVLDEAAKRRAEAASKPEAAAGAATAVNDGDLFPEVVFGNILSQSTSFTLEAPTT